MFYSSSFFDGFWFLIRSPTKNPLKLGRRYQMVIFATSNRSIVPIDKICLHKSPHFWKKSRAKIPLVMGSAIVEYKDIHV